MLEILTLTVVSWVTDPRTLERYTKQVRDTEQSIELLVQRPSSPLKTSYITERQIGKRQLWAIAETRER